MNEKIINNQRLGEVLQEIEGYLNGQGLDLYEKRLALSTLISKFNLQIKKQQTNDLVMNTNTTDLLKKMMKDFQKEGET